MDAGKLDQTITIELPNAGVNELNEPVGGFTPLATVSAMVTQTPGREFLKGEYHGEDRAVFTIRYRTDIAVTARLSWAGKYWDVTSITGTRRMMFLQLGATSIDGRD